MFALFYSLYVSMFVGSWDLYSLQTIRQQMQPVFNALGSLATSIFGDNQITNFGELMFAYSSTDYINLVAFVLALITSIGIVVMAVKGVKKAFGVFFAFIK